MGKSIYKSIFEELRKISKEDKKNEDTVINLQPTGDDSEDVEKDLPDEETGEPVAIDYGDGENLEDDEEENLPKK